MSESKGMTRFKSAHSVIHLPVSVTHRYSMNRITLVPTTKAQLANAEFKNNAKKYAYNVELIPYSNMHTHMYPIAVNWEDRVANKTVSKVATKKIEGSSNDR